MNIFKKIVGLAGLLSLCSGFSSEKADLWQQDHFSMFIHFGLYSQLGGVWDGKPIDYGYSEQIQAHAGIYSDWYEAVAEDFNPYLWNADSIVNLARQAGMKTIVFTSKHHDGFCMYHTGYSDFNIVDATPYARDILKDLAEACERGEMKLGIYFSLIDWHFPEAAPISHHNMDLITPAHHQYNLRQVEELLTRYGPISEFWFDMGSLTPQQSEELYLLVHRLQPQCMVSSRLGNDCSDFIVMPDNVISSSYMPCPWQAPASMYRETWGYRSWQKTVSDEEKAQEKYADLKRIVSLGGCYLLNIGPRGDGSVTDHEKNVLRKIGEYIRKDGAPKQNAVLSLPQPTEYGISYMDYALRFPSKIAYNLEFPASARSISVSYTEDEVGRQLEVNGDTVLLNGGEKRVFPKIEVEVKQAYRSPAFQGFERRDKKAVPQEEVPVLPVQKMKIKPRHSIEYRQIVHADQAGDYLVKVVYTTAFKYSGQGQEIFVKSQKQNQRNTALLRLHLKKGENVLDFVFLNRFAGELEWGIDYDVPQEYRVQKIYDFPGKSRKDKVKKVHIRSLDRFPSADMGLHNLNFQGR